MFRNMAGSLRGVPSTFAVYPVRAVERLLRSAVYGALSGGL